MCSRHVDLERGNILRIEQRIYLGTVTLVSYQNGTKTIPFVLLLYTTDIIIVLSIKLFSPFMIELKHCSHGLNNHNLLRFLKACSVRLQYDMGVPG